MKTMLRMSIVLAFLVFAVVAQAQVINNFDAAPADTNYWEWYEPVQEGGASATSAHYAISTNADSSKGWIERTYVTDPVFEGGGAMQLEYSVHNSEGWGGYSKVHHYFPDTLSTATYDWSLYDSLSFSYYNVVPQDSTGRVHLRLLLSDYADITDSAYHDLGEYFYSFHYILDDTPGWHTINMALERGDSWAGTDWTYTGWAGEAGNGVLDRDHIKGFAFEFSMSGGGEGDVAHGAIIIDDLKLTGSKNAITLFPGFEDGGNADGVPNGWGGWMAAWDGWGAQTHFATPMVTDAHSGDYHAELGVDVGNGYAVIWPEGDSIGCEKGQTWELSTWIKDISPADPGGDFAALKIEATDVDGNNVLSEEIIQTGVTSEWQLFKAMAVMPVGAVEVQAVLVATKWLDDGVAAIYAFDDVAFQSLGTIDDVSPVAVENITAIPSTNYNLVTWDEIAGEDGETYTVYASPFPIGDIDADYVNIIASGHLEGAPSVVHYLYTPVNNETVNTFYAVVCTDASANVGPPGFSATSFSNEALGIPTISLNPPSNFVADGFMDEWASTTPFVLADPNSWGVSSIWGAVDNNADCSADMYLAIDNDYLYFAADVVDNVYTGYTGEGSWWEFDAFQLFIGMYDQRGARHNALYRGNEPDYGLVFTNDYYRRDNDGMYTMGTNGDGGYYFEGFSSDYVIEAKISLDSLAIGGGFSDARFIPENGTRLLIEPIIHDNDGGGAWEGNVQSSPLNSDNAWQTPGVWSYTFVGDMDLVATDNVAQPNSYQLGANFPNPFNPTTTINYEIGNTEQVRLTIFNVVGQEVMQLVNEVQDAGVHQVHFDASALSSGVYMYRLEAGSFGDTQKMILLK